MHLREFFFQPVRFTISAILVLLFGLVMTSVVLSNAGLPNPISKVGEAAGSKLLDSIFGQSAGTPGVSATSR